MVIGGCYFKARVGNPHCLSAEGRGLYKTIIKENILALKEQMNEKRVSFIIQKDLIFFISLFLPRFY